MSDILQKIGSFVGDAAPVVGTILGGPLGGAAGGLVKMLASTFGISGSDAENPGKLLSAITADPESALKLRQFELENKVELGKLALQQDQLRIEQEKMHLKDKASARQREASVTKATGKKNYELYILAAINVIGFFGALILFICIGHKLNLNQSAWTAVAMLLGALVASYKDIIGYFFGSSKSSGDKTDLIMQMRSTD